MLHHQPGKDAGWLWKMSSSTPNALDFISYLPEKTALASSGNLLLTPLWKAMNQEAVLNADLGKGLDFLSEQVKKSTGLDLGQLLASLGPNYSIVLTVDETRQVTIPGGPAGKPITISEPALAVVVQVQDDVLINRIEQQLAMLPMVTQSTLGDLKARTLSTPLPMAFLRPMVAWKKGLIIVASNEQLVKEMQEVKEGKKPGLAANPQFKKLMTGLPTKGCDFSYLAPVFQKTLNEIQMASIRQGSNTADASVLKMIEYVQQATRQGTVARVVEETPEGWLSTSHGGTGPAQIVAIGAAAPVALIAGASVPSFIRARSRTEATVIKQDLRMIDAAIDQWAIEHNKKAGDQATTDDIKPYLKEGSPLYNRLISNPGGTTFPLVNGAPTFIIPPVGGKLIVPREILIKYRDVTTPDFWAPYQAY
jgi:hypothetical protein